MFSTDAFLELLERLNRHRFRTALTTFSVAWGILMLVLLLGAGTGLGNMVEWEFRDDAINSIWIYPSSTSLPYKGHPVGRSIRLTNDDYEALAALPMVDHISSRFYLSGEVAVSYRDRHGSFSVRATHPDHMYREKTLIRSGRFLNDLDLNQRRKVAVIGEEVKRFLFDEADPLGEYIQVNDIAYRVVGVFDDVGGPGEVQRIYIPITTAQVAYGGGDRVHRIIFTMGDASVEESAAIAEGVQRLLAERHHFDPEDPRAVRIRNNLEHYHQIAQIIAWIRGFVWIVGIGTVFAGVVGVSNIMLVSVQERTREIGLRKALGATPGSIVSMILQEAIVLTSVAGYAGLVAGVAVVEVVNRSLPENDYFRDPEVDLPALLFATLLVVVFGAFAGLFPALRAARVDPVVALRDE